MAIARDSFMHFSCVGKMVTMQGSQSKISARELVTKLNRRRAQRAEDGQAELGSTHLVLKEAVSAQIQPIVTGWKVGLPLLSPFIFLK